MAHLNSAFLCLQRKKAGGNLMQDTRKKSPLKVAFILNLAHFALHTLSWHDYWVYLFRGLHPYSQKVQ